MPTKIVGARDLLGQVLETTDGRKFRLTGLDVLLPTTADTQAIQKRYGVLPDATAVARRPLPVRRPTPPLPWNQPVGPPTAVINPTGPQPYRTPFDHKTYVGDPLDQVGKHWNGMGSVLEGHGLTYASKARIENTLYRSTQRVNRLAGRKLVPPSHVASGAAGVLRGMTNAKLAQFGSKFGGKIAGVGTVLSFGKVVYEYNTSTYNAHTFVDVGMLTITITGMLVTAGMAGATAPVWVPIAGAVILVYGIADYAFDLSGGVDQAIGRDSPFKGAWEKLNMGR